MNAGTPGSAPGRASPSSSLRHAMEWRAGTASVAFFFDRLQLRLGGVAFTHDPVERLEEIIDARSRGLRNPVTDDLVDLARALPLQQQLCIFLVQANHSV